MSDLSTCRSCDAPILWVVTEKGKRMPLDPEPTEDLQLGAFIKLRVEPNGDKVVHFLKPDERSPSAKQRYSSHFQTCPDRVER